MQENTRNRNNMFYSDESLQFEIDAATSYLSTDTNQSVILYRIDKIKTTSDDLYGETKKDSIVYKTPVEIPCLYNVSEAVNKSYDKDKGVARYLQTGNLTVSLFVDTLTKLKVDVSYGDYIAVKLDVNNMLYFTVSNDGKKNYDNKHTMYGIKPVYRTIECVPVDPIKFKGI